MHIPDRLRSKSSLTTLMLIAFAAGSPGFVAGQSSTKDIYLVPDAAGHQWCACKDSVAWRAQVGALSQLARKANILPGDRSERQAFRIRNGEATLERAQHRQLVTGRLISPVDDWLPEVPVAVRGQDLPFAGLLASGPSTALPGDSWCRAARLDD